MPPSHGSGVHAAEREGWAGWAGRALGSPGRVFSLVLVLMFLNLAVWSLATPLFSSPDEPSQVARAAALVRGQLIGRTVRTAGNATTVITIPQVYAGGEAYTSCYTFKPAVPATCAGAYHGSTRVVSTSTYSGRYPPLYYAIVGLPSLLTVSPTGIYLMRLMSDLLNAVFLALAVLSVAVWSRSRLLVVAVLLAITPMVFFLGAVVNPSGLEITSAICLWCSGLVLVLERAGAPPTGLVAIVAAATATLLLSRGLSPLWVALIIALLALVAGGRTTVRLLSARAVRWAMVPLAACAIFAVAWIAVARALDLLPVGVPVTHGESRAHLVASLFGLTGTWVQQMVGVFGWLDTVPPLVSTLVWLGAMGLVVLLALGCARPRHLLALVLLGAVVLVAPVAISYDQAHRLGVIWQARYILPMVVGLPLMSVALIERAGFLGAVRARLATVLCVAVAVGDLAAFAEALRRYAVGVTGPLDYLHSRWHPPGSLLALTLGTLVAVALLASCTRLLVTRPVLVDFPADADEGPSGVDGPGGAAGDGPPALGDAPAAALSEGRE